eukprot:scaffold141842_cov34-Attheya_sp.AAC.1
MAAGAAAWSSFRCPSADSAYIIILNLQMLAREMDRAPNYGIHKIIMHGRNGECEARAAYCIIVHCNCSSV